MNKVFEKICKRCGKEYIAKKAHGQFCGKSCGTKYRFENIKEDHICDYCGEPFKKKSNSQRMCGNPKCHSLARVERSYRYLNGNVEAYISLLLKKKDRQNLSLSYVLDLYHNQKGLCALSGREMTFIKKVDSPKVHTNLSIDRIDSSLPYQEGNIQLVCAVTNIMKTTLTMEEMYEWCTSISNHLKG